MNLKLTDLHNHTKYSYDGTNTPEEIIENAFIKGISVVGISDHQFSIGAKLGSYIEHINALKEKYKGKIEVKCGLEIGTRPSPSDLSLSLANSLDYCLFECLDSPAAMDFFVFLEWVKLFNIPKGFAHTDIFELSDRYGTDVLEIMKKNNIFWEINTSGNYSYYYDFITNKEKRATISKSKISLSVGSDTHWTHNYSISKIESAHTLITKMGNHIIFS